MSTPATPSTASPFPGWLVTFLRNLFTLLERVAPRLGARIFYRLLTRPRRRATPASARNLMIRSRRRVLTVNGAPVVAYSWGEGYRTALVLHGWESRAAHFAGLIDALVNAGYRVVALDAPAHGASGGRESHLPAFWAALDAVIAADGEPHIIIGHSLGGAVAALHVSHLPADRSMPLLVSIAAPRAPRTWFDLAARFLGVGPRLMTAFYARLASLFPWEVDDLDLRRHRPHGTIMVVHDSDDPVVPVAAGRELAAIWGADRYLETDGAGHYRIIHEPRVHAAILEFVVEHCPPAPVSTRAALHSATL